MSSLPYKYFSAGVFLVVMCLFFRQAAQNAIVKNGTNVCEKTVSFQQSYRIAYDSLQQSVYYTSCGFLWASRCATRYRYYYRTSYRTTYGTSYRTKYQCCKGWSQVGDQCTKAICTQPCVNGTCTKPDNCSCYSGYYGNLCDRDCPSHKWGPHCKHDCLCQNNAKCSPHTGTCTCTPGWEGQYCDKPCDQGYYGDQCQNNCTCQNGATCDHVTGNCTCAAGYRGQECEFPCEDGTFGVRCKSNCSCRNKGFCSHVDGSCVCTSWFTGKHCECIVRNGLLGCKSCECGAWGTCDPFTGGCVCKPGSIGESCRRSQCPNGTYVPGCNGNCECNNSATCYHGNRSCSCMPGWTGNSCTNPCPSGYYGNKCQLKCDKCEDGTSCDPITGQCTCVGEWYGEVCVTISNSTGNPQQNKSHPFVNTNIPLILSLFGGFLALFLVSAALGCFLYRRQGPVWKVHRDPSAVTFTSACSKQHLRVKEENTECENPATRKVQEEKNVVRENDENSGDVCGNALSTENDNDGFDYVDDYDDVNDSDDVIDVGEIGDGDVNAVDGTDVDYDVTDINLMNEPAVLKGQQPRPTTGSPVSFTYENPCFGTGEDESEGLYYTIDGASEDGKTSSCDRESLNSWRDMYENVGVDVVLQLRGLSTDGTPGDTTDDGTEA